MFSFLNSLLSLDIGESLKSLWESTGLHELVSTFTAGGWQNLVMILIACVLFYLAIVKKLEPLLLLPIAFGMFIVNIPGVYHILFGTKGYTISSVASKVTVATGTSGELSALFGTDLDALLKQLKETEAGKHRLRFMVFIDIFYCFPPVSLPSFHAFNARRSFFVF